ncbi:uracil-DNA glycosylase family protein [Paraglaciecola aquimarina]|uniref:Uracil-DNA glycosylase family protein n=1 Tax=Paraglaciecola algarum TaxID=3050085 RepID=A0ABS9DBH6_9ALTE|nr:uracil-DNA glycosylase family protein [Paraglaciecola sp. G1-23]MCF2950315.1 uracil-DNA glycosylase family protein [Paraglaciecola sp. G1-23]
MNIVSKISHCIECKEHLPFAPRPIFQYSEIAQIIIVGQAPGIKAHQSHLAWNDASGIRLREWLNMSDSTFYNKELISIIPMGFCYPGRGKSGDLPPRPECAKKWHSSLLSNSRPKLQILIGKYAQDYYLQDKKTLTERLKNWQDYLPAYLVLPHPSPRNNIWLKKHAWFEQEALPAMQKVVNKYLK